MSQRTLYKQWWWILLVLVIVGEIGFLLLSTHGALKGATSVAYAHEIMRRCKEVSYRPTCYENEVPRLLSNASMEQVFEVIRLLRTEDTSYQFCHVLAHKIGGREVEKDPSQWIDVIPRCPQDGLCSNGCLHGVSVARFNKEILDDEEIEAVLPELSIACEPRGTWNPTELDKAICYHGVGHMLMHITDAQTSKSLALCERLARKEDGRDYRQVCIEGVFMQIFQPLEPEDIALVDRLAIKPTRENLKTFCAAHGEDIVTRSACWREGWPLFREEVKTPEGIASFCSTSPDEEQRKNCYTTVLSIQGRSSLTEPERMAHLCNGLAHEWQGRCFAIGATAVVEEDRTLAQESVAFCSRAASPSAKEMCYGSLQEKVRFIFGASSSSGRELCQALPLPWRENCLSGL